MTRAPLSTYRLQIRESFPLGEAADTVEYLHALGTDWVYLSPLLKAEEGSDHGYDVVDHSLIDPARGGAEGLVAVSAAAHERGMGVLVDIVPNHVGVATPEAMAWWWDVLARGRESRYAEAFDIDWAAGEGRLRLPILGSADDTAAVEIDGDELTYYDHRLPIAPGTADDGADAATVLSRQHYELLDWHRADDLLNYRRFFAVNTLAGIRVELPWVFDESHAEILRWFADSLVDGLRVDHPDGLFDPKGYAEKLAAATGGYLIVEKILEPGEELPSGWAVDGTTGYDALGTFDRVLVDPAGQAKLDEVEDHLRHSPISWTELVHERKRAVADGILGSEIRRIVRDAGHGDDAAWIDAVAELVATFPVYRSYLPVGQDHLDAAVAEATGRRPELSETIEAVAGVLGDTAQPAALRFQQTSGMIMAKGVEDNAFYRYSRLTSLNEVGADPGEFSLTVDGFHDAQQRRYDEWPEAMTTLSTHDTKRGEDVRARLDVLAEIPDEWARTLDELRERMPLGDGPMENLLWQAVVGSAPASRERLHAYAEKASRESGTSTSWTDPDEDFEKRMHELVDSVFDDQRVRGILDRILDRVREPGYANSLTMKLLQLTAPGVPDVYQGSELWERSLVDPDNRRAVDFAERRGLLRAIEGGVVPPVDETGAAKLLVVHRALTLKRDRPELFDGYLPVAATGEAAAHVVAFDRGGAIAVGTRLPVGLFARGGWGDTAIALPHESFHDVLTGRPVDSAEVRLADLLDTYPVALLAPDA